MPYESLYHPLTGKLLDPFQQNVELKAKMDKLEKDGFKPIEFLLFENKREEQEEVVIFFHKRRGLLTKIKEGLKKNSLIPN